MIIKPHYDIFHDGISYDISYDRRCKSYQNRQRQVVIQYFTARVARSYQGSYDRGFLLNGVSCGDGKGKGQNHHHYIQKPLNHDFIAAHVIAGKGNGHVILARHEVRQHGAFAYDLPYFIGFVLLLFIRQALIIIRPSIAISQSRVAHIIKSLVGYEGYGKLVRVKHHIRIVLKQTTVIRKRRQTAYFVFSFIYDYFIPYGYLIVFGIQPI